MTDKLGQHTRRATLLRSAMFRIPVRLACSGARSRVGTSLARTWSRKTWSRETGSDQMSDQPRDLLGGPEPDEHDLLGGSKPDENDLLGGPESTQSDLLGGPDADDDDPLGSPEAGYCGRPRTGANRGRAARGP